VLNLSIQETLPLGASQERARRSAFDVETLQLRGIRRLLASTFANPPQWALGFLRIFLPVLPLLGWRYWGPLPIPTLRRWVLLTRSDDVREVLEQNATFNVWWGADLALLNDGEAPGTPFILGLDRWGDQAELYRRGLFEVMTAFRRDDVACVVAPNAARCAAIALDRAGGHVDAIQELLVEVFLDTVVRYFGVPVVRTTRSPSAIDETEPDREKQKREKAEFFAWTVAPSGLLFGPPFERDRAMKTALAATDRLALAVDEAIDSALEAAAGTQEGVGGTVLDRLAASCRKGEGMTPLKMRSIMMGMITGSVPTNAVAAGHILDTLLTYPEMMAAAREAALQGDDALLTRCLFEAMRFKPLNPGPWRICRQDFVVARGTPRERKIRAGTYILASTQSAMFDARAVKSPRRFDPTRDPSDLLHFGHGLHWCVAKYTAEVQITQAMKALLVRNGVRRAPGREGRLKMLGLFPEHLYVDYDAPAGTAG
jgi:cytochrome P450